MPGLVVTDTIVEMRRLLALAFAFGFVFGPLAPLAHAFPFVPVPHAPAPFTSQAAVAATGDAWWNRLMGPQEQIPATARNQLMVQNAPVHSVPANAIAVGANGQEVDKIAAIDFNLGPTSGLVADAAHLRLQESAAPGANVNADLAVVGACAITSTWKPVRNGNWDQKASGDCTKPVLGARGSTGQWSFDITALAEQWYDGSVPPSGILLFVAGGTVVPGQVPAAVRDPAPADQDFQVSFQDVASGGVKLDLTTSPAPLTFQPPPDPEPVAEVLGEQLVFEEPFFDPNLGLTTLAAPPAAAAPLPRVAFVQPVAAQERIPVPDIWGNLPGGAILLVPILAAFALMLMTLLGEAGDPVVAQHREGAISRALGREQL